MALHHCIPGHWIWHPVLVVVVADVLLNQLAVFGYLEFARVAVVGVMLIDERDVLGQQTVYFEFNLKEPGVSKVAALLWTLLVGSSEVGVVFHLK